MTDAKNFPPLPEPVTLNSIMSRHMPRDGGDRRITIRIQNPGGLTAHQTVDVERADFGFDWEGHQLVITPAVPLTTLTPEQLADIATSVRAGQSWHAYQVHKRHRDEMAAVTSERDALAQRVKELEKDAERLDWIDSNPYVVHPDSYGYLATNKSRLWRWYTREGSSPGAPTLREAIDAAMQQAGKAEGGVCE